MDRVLSGPLARPIANPEAELEVHGRTREASLFGLPRESLTPRDYSGTEVGDLLDGIIAQQLLVEITIREQHLNTWSKERTKKSRVDADQLDGKSAFAGPHCNRIGRKLATSLL